MATSAVLLRGRGAVRGLTTVAIDYKPREWQHQVHLKRRRFTVLALHRRAGKTKLGVMELVDKALRCDKQMALFFYVAPELKQATALVWRELKATLEPMRKAGAVEVREGDLSVTFKHNGAMVRLYGADNPDAMRGVRLDGVVMDEVAQMKPEVWHEIIQPALSDRLGWALFIGTPKGLNLFSELFFKGAARMAEGSEDWYAAKWTVYDTEALDPKEVERLRQDMAGNENAWAREFMCDFAASGDDQLISLGEAEAATKHSYHVREFERSPIILGVDPARFGDDRSVIVRRQGLGMPPPIVLRGVDNMELADRVAIQISEHKPDAVFIDSGGGAGVIDRLRQMGHRVQEVPFGGKAMDDKQFKNRRSEMWWKMRDWIRGGGLIPDMLALKQELATPTYTYDSAGRKVLESKEQIKKRLQDQGSPDIADALCLTFAAPVHVRGERDRMRSRKSRESFDPFS